MFLYYSVIHLLVICYPNTLSTLCSVGNTVLLFLFGVNCFGLHADCWEIFVTGEELELCTVIVSACGDLFNSQSFVLCACVYVTF